VETAFIPPELHDLRRRVALAYRAAKVAGCDEQASFERAFSVYAEAEPGKAADRIPASHTVNLMIASGRSTPIPSGFGGR
jgi:hypothetical protein